MPFIKLKRSPDASTILEFFDSLPSWENLSSKIANVFNIPSTNVGVAFVHNDRESITLTNDQGLQQYFSEQSPKEFKFVVQDIHKPDPATTIASTWSAASNLVCLSNTNNNIKLFCLLLSPSNPIFSVDINKNLTVDDLRVEIKKKMGAAFPHYELGLWRLNPPVSSTDVGQLQSPEDIKGCTKLHPTSVLSTQFPSALSLDVHVVVMHIPSGKHWGGEDHARVAKKPKLERTPTQERQWSVFGAINLTAHYHVDFATQAETQRCLDKMARQDFCLLVGSRASGKTTRLYQIRRQLDEACNWCLYVSFNRLDIDDPTKFWTSFGRAAKNGAVQRDFPFPESTISSQADFLDAFHVTKWPRKLVLLLDELSALYNASGDVRNQCLTALRELKDNNEEYAVSSVMAAGTFSSVHLNPTDNSLSPFNVATHVQNPNFTLDETRALFRQFMEEVDINIEDDVIKDVWVRSAGHPGMVCLCGGTISQNIASLAHDSTLTYQDWFEFPAERLYTEISGYNTFRSMLWSLLSPSAQGAVRLLRSDFLGYPGDVTLSNFQDQCHAHFLTAEGVLIKLEPGSSTYRMTSALVDGLVRKTVMTQLFPNAPQVNPIFDEFGHIDVLDCLTKSLRCFDKEHIHLASFRSYKSSNMLKVNGSRNAQVPRDSVYDTELMRILSNWLQTHYGWTVTGQRHLKNPFGKHKYTDIVLDKPGNPTIVLELVATGDEQFVNSHIDKTPEYMQILKAQTAWIIHFTREDQYVPVWQSDDILNKGVNLVHIWHNAEFTNVGMIANWKDYTGIKHLDTQWQEISL